MQRDSGLSEQNPPRKSIIQTVASCVPTPGTLSRAFEVRAQDYRRANALLKEHLSNYLDCARTMECTIGAPANIHFSSPPHITMKTGFQLLVYLEMPSAWWGVEDVCWARGSQNHRARTGLSRPPLAPAIGGLVPFLRPGSTLCFTFLPLV